MVKGSTADRRALFEAVSKCTQLVALEIDILGSGELASLALVLEKLPLLTRLNLDISLGVNKTDAKAICRRVAHLVHVSI